MALACNIDAEGKAYRLKIGIVLSCVGAITTCLWALRTTSLAAWCVSVAFLLAGALSIFEARAGWCVVRAMGIKTRL